MISHLVFLLIAALYYVTRRLYRALFGDHRVRISQVGDALGTLVAQHGGAFRRTGPVSYEVVLPDGTLLTARRRRRAVLSVRIPAQANYSITFQRLPRPLYAFLEAFLPDTLRIGTHPYLTTTTTTMESVAELKSRPEFNQLFDSLSAQGYSFHLDAGGLHAWKRLRAADTSDVALMEQVRGLRNFARICLRMPSIPIHAVQSSARCAFCREDIPGTSSVITCASCGTPHHQECFELNGKCTVFGCNSIRLAEAVLAR